MSVVRTTREEHPLPAVLMHWAHALAMIVLIVTGFELYNPYFIAPLGLMRLIHMVAAFVLVITTVVRIYWMFLGKGSAGGGSTRLVPDWRHFGPERANKGRALETLKYYLFLRETHPRSAKYNTLQKATYLLWLVLIVAATVTGAALWGPTGAVLTPRVLALGGLIWVRSIHYLIMWLFIVTLMLHIYLSIAEASAQLSIMFLWQPTEGPADGSGHKDGA